MDKNLDQEIVGYYKNLEIPNDVFQSVQSSYFDHQKSQNWFNWFRWPAAIAACVGLFYLGGIMLPQMKTQSNLLSSVAAEISLNHHKFKDLDFNFIDFQVLSEKMEKLDFSLSRPTRLGPDIDVIGARYCSIQGKIAAQVRLTDEKGRSMTLYQSKGIEALQNLDNSAVSIDGLEVTMWFENGLFNGLAKQAD